VPAPLIAAAPVKGMFSIFMSSVPITSLNIE
jgi:hypothetical protein